MSSRARCIESAVLCVFMLLLSPTALVVVVVTLTGPRSPLPDVLIALGMSGVIALASLFSGASYGHEALLHFRTAREGARVRADRGEG